MAKDDLIDVQGTVMAVHSGGLYRVQCDAGHEVLAQLSGRMRRFRIKVVPGDRVTVGGHARANTDESGTQPQRPETSQLHRLN